MCDLIKFSFRQGFSDIIGESVNVIYNADNFVPNPVREVGLCSAYQTRVPTTSVYFVGVDAIEPQFVYTIGDSAALQGLDVSRPSSAARFLLHGTCRFVFPLVRIFDPCSF